MGGEVVGLVLSLGIAVVSLCGGLVVTAVTLGVSAAVVWFVFKRLADSGGQVVVGGPQLVVSSPLLDALAASTSSSSQPSSPKPPVPADERGEYVKRCTCPACGAANATPSKHAYVYCAFCGELMDFDFQAAISDTRSKLPGPAYEALVRRHQPALEAAKAAGDADRYEALQREIFDAYATHCPAALSPRIGDPLYRERFVAYSAKSAALTELDPAASVTLAAQTAAMGGLAWDRSRGQPRVTSESFWRLIDAVDAHQATCLDVIERHDLVSTHPDRPSRDILRRIGTSMLVQGWMPYLESADAERLLDQSGLRGEYTHVPPPELHRGDCPSCGAAVEVVDGAKRVLCHACGHMVGVGAGSLRCHGCATPMVVPEQGNVFHCPSCDVELKRMRWPT